MKKQYQRMVVLLTAILILFSACRNNEKTNWAYYMIGYDDSSLKISRDDDITIGIIDMAETVTADNGTSTGITHLDLSKKIIIDLVPNVQIIEKQLVNGTPKELATAINKLVNQEVRLINIALGIPDDNMVLKQAVIEASNKGVLLVCAGGNNYGDLLYPALYDETISCLARNINEEDMFKNPEELSKKSFSAPGYHVPIEGKSYSGTSVACAFISAACTIGILNNPQISNADLIELLKSSCVDSSENSYGVVRIDKLIA